MLPPIIPDEPVRTRSSDRYAHYETARVLTSVIERAPADGSVVVGLHGPWGSGKTTILSLAETLLTGDGWAVTWCSPWLYSAGGQGAIMTGLLTEACAALPPKTPAGKAAAQYRKRIASVVGNALRLTGREGVARKAEEALDSIYNVRRELSRAIKASGTRLVVFVDDVDRLVESELRELFAALRAAGDIHGITYVVAMDDHEVARVIGNERLDGAQFLEKLIAIPFPVQPVRYSILYREAMAKLRDMLSACEIDTSDFDTLLVAQLSKLLRPHLQTPRDVVRLLNRLAVTAEMAKSAELSARDYVVCEVLAVFDTELYVALRSNPEAALLLVGMDEVILAGTLLKDVKDLARDRASSVFGKLLALPYDDSASASPTLNDLTISTDKREARRQAVQLILPQLGYTIAGQADWYTQTSKPGRLAHPDYFDRYFTYTANLGDITDAEILSRWYKFVEGEAWDLAFAAVDDELEALIRTKILAAIELMPGLDTEVVVAIAMRLAGAGEEALRRPDAFPAEGYRWERPLRYQLATFLVALVERVALSQEHSREIMEQIWNKTEFPAFLIESARSWAKRVALWDEVLPSVVDRVCHLASKPDVFLMYISRPDTLQQVGSFCLDNANAIRACTDAVREEPRLAATLVSAFWNMNRGPHMELLSPLPLLERLVELRTLDEALSRLVLDSPDALDSSHISVLEELSKRGGVAEI